MMNTYRLAFLTFLIFGVTFLIHINLQSPPTSAEQIRKIWDEKREMTAVKKYQENIKKIKEEWERESESKREI